MMPAWRWRTLLASAGATFLIVIAGCTSADSSGRATTTPSATSPATSPPSASAPPTTADVRKEIAATWRAFWADVVAVGRTADWSSPRLAAHATGPALQRLRGQFRVLHDHGWVTRGTVRLRSSQVTGLTSRTAKVHDCVDVSQFIRVDAKTGKPIDRPGGAPDNETATLVLESGTWKVQQTVVSGKCAS